MLSTAWKFSQFRAYPSIASSEPSFGDEVREFLASDLGTLEKRLYTANRRLISYTWTPAPHETGTGFYISMDISTCRRGLKRHTIAGTYTYSNGTTANLATFGDILDDFKSMRQNAPTPQLGEPTIMNHVLTAATQSRDRTNKFLDGGLICKPPGSNLDTVHNELRRLLWYSVSDNGRKRIREFSILLGTSSIAGTVAGLAASGVTALAIETVEYRCGNGHERCKKTLQD